MVFGYVATKFLLGSYQFIYLNLNISCLQFEIIKTSGIFIIRILGFGNFTLSKYDTLLAAPGGGDQGGGDRSGLGLPQHPPDAPLIEPRTRPQSRPLPRPRHRPGHTEALEAEAGPEGLADEGERTADTGLRGEQLALANSGLFSLSGYYLHVW